MATIGAVCSSEGWSRREQKVLCSISRVEGSFVLIFRVGSCCVLDLLKLDTSHDIKHLMQQEICGANSDMSNERGLNGVGRQQN